ncbi:MAG: hypothetical protein V4611_04165 [Patescibacteria group bacterium]
MSEELQTQESQVHHNPESQEQPSSEPTQLDSVKAQLVATAVNNQMSGGEAVQFSEAKHMANEFQAHVDDPNLPVRPYGIRNDGYGKFKPLYIEAREDSRPDVRGVEKTHFSSLAHLEDVHNAEGKSLQDPYVSTSSNVSYHEGEVVETEAKLAEMPIGPWNQTKRRSRAGSGSYDRLVFSDLRDVGVGSENYALYARQRSETYAAIAELNEELAQAEKEITEPAIDEGARRRIEHDIAYYKSKISELEAGTASFGREPRTLGSLDSEEQSEQRKLLDERTRLSREYAKGAEYYNQVSEDLNQNLNNVSQQFEDFYDLAPDTFSNKSSKEFLDSAKEYFSLKEDIRQADFAARRSKALVGDYEFFTEALNPDSDKEIASDQIGVASLSDRVGGIFNFDTDRGGNWIDFNKSIQGLDGEALEQKLQYANSYYGLNALATAENLKSYVEFSGQIATEWLDLSPRQTLDRFLNFAKELAAKQNDALQQKQNQLDEFVAGLKGNQDGNQEDNQQ